MHNHSTLAAGLLVFGRIAAGGWVGQCIGNAVDGNLLASAKADLADWCNSGNTVSTWHFQGAEYSEGSEGVVVYVCNEVVHGQDPGCSGADLDAAISAITDKCGYGIAADINGLSTVNYGFAPAGLQSCPQYNYGGA
ncbi:MAG: hypothetical protein Q9162_007295 [Coniocarpon cinnabarinum]